MKNDTKTNTKAKFTVEELSRAKRFCEVKDVLMAVCDHNTTYTKDEADALIKKYYEREVN